MRLQLAAADSIESKKIDLSHTLKHVRQLSNIAQALENLATQCENYPAYTRLRDLAREQLALVRAAQFRELHR
ncbi:MAG: hypothetical protein JO102_00295 [Elusimicrobia bacterium]|nr:hypothetical protein [Elusimicrobiota bacterium]